ncbi:hypothetical protein Q3G72_013808 [Acer saccharum]|nr:hypothetical protein Q3G72_013808 [Acer saccharum]
MTWLLLCFWLEKNISSVLRCFGLEILHQRKLDKCFGFSTDELPHDSLVQLVDGCREHTRKLVEKNIIVALNTLKSRTRAALLD